MEWTIPIQTFEPASIRLGQIGRGIKPMAPISYHSAEVDATFMSLSLLLPILTVKSYDAATSRLQISLAGSPVAAAKLQSLQTILLKRIHTQQSGWFPPDRTRTAEDLRAGFQPMIENGVLHLYCPSNTAGAPNEVQVYSGGVWTRGITSPAALAPGKQLRLAIRIQGVSFHQHPVSGAWTGKFRLQHRVLAMLMV